MYFRPHHGESPRAWWFVPVLLPSLPFYDLAHQERPPLLRGMARRALSAEEHTQACELLLAAARYHDCADWLLDARANPQPPPLALQHWLREEFLPRAAQELGRAAHVAFLVPPEVRQALGRLGYPARLALGPGAGQLGWFTDEAPARAWLAQPRARRPGPP